MNHSFFPTSFLLMDSLYLIFACYVISVYLRMDVYAKIFFFTVYIYNVGWFGIAPCVNIYNKNLVEQKHSPN